MIIFDSGFDITGSNGADKITPIALNNGKFYLDEACYNANKTQIDALSITNETRDILESEYVVNE